MIFLKKINKKYFWAAAFFIMLNFSFFSLNLNDFFVSDDFDWIYLTHYSAEPLYTYFGTNYHGGHEGGSYRPLMNVLFWLDYKIWNFNPFGYHLTNFVFHLGNVFLVYLLALKFFQKHKKNDLIALLSAAFFSIMPNHAEAVIWISGRGDLASAFFYLLSFYLYLAFRERKKYLYFGLSIFFSALAILSKEMALTLPAVILLYELYEFYKQPIKRFPELIKNSIYSLAYGLIVVLFFAARYSAIGILNGYYGKSKFSLDLGRLYSMFLNMISDAVLFLSLRLKYVAFFQDKKFLFLGCLFLFIIILILAIKKYRPEIMFWLGFYFISLIPVLNLIFGIINDEGERYSYLPSVAVAVILASALVYIKKRANKYVFLILISFTFAYLGYFMLQKSLIWDRASKISHKIISVLPEKINTKSKDPEGAIIFSLPDNYRGAQVMRNGLKQAVKIFYPDYDLDAFPLPIFLILNENNFDQQIMDWKYFQNGFLGTTADHSFAVTGPDTQSSDDLSFELWNYNYNNFTSDTIRVGFTDQFIERARKKKVYFLVYNNGDVINLHWQNDNALQ